MGVILSVRYTTANYDLPHRYITGHVDLGYKDLYEYKMLMSYLSSPLPLSCHLAGQHGSSQSGRDAAFVRNERRNAED